MILGLVAGTGLAFFFEYLDNTIKLPEDIQRYLRVPYLGPVPAIALNGTPESKEKPELVTLHSPKSTERKSEATATRSNLRDRPPLPHSPRHR